MQTESFLEIAEQFKVVFLDSYGVLKNYKGLIEGVQYTIDLLRKKNILIRVLTNDASRSQQQQAENLHSLGLHNIDESEIITSGMMAKQFLQQKILSGKIAYLGTENSAEYILPMPTETRLRLTHDPKPTLILIL